MFAQNRYQDNADEDDIDGEGDIDIIVEIIKVLNEVINNLVMKCWMLFYFSVKVCLSWHDGSLWKVVCSEYYFIAVF